ncbi:hypothetical protein IWQ62_002541 [Dispira parvispora]|uniref:Protein arginine methyltransferase NDUFAF7 n=1 Tax=Dispira parvispora TaxID=1520584 RepID=A0A9W8AR39_9FUNG|nr:hypothetical protein IWQ62_002541 [Dispira parvispora]
MYLRPNPLLLSSTFHARGFSRQWSRGLSGKPGTTVYKSSLVSGPKEDLSPVGKMLVSSIKATGPISVAQYMRQALQHPIGGYYKVHGDVLGTQGDFITSPEISQMFGELLGVWFVANWRLRPRTVPIRIIELGPGRGTLMKDMLRAMRRFGDFYRHIQGIHLVESSNHLFQRQKDSLGVADCTADSLHSASSSPQAATTNSKGVSGTTESGISVEWYPTLQNINLDDTAFNVVVAHEFFDALPVYKFQRIAQGWREILVDIDDSKSSPHHFRFVLGTTPSLASQTLLKSSHISSAQFQPGDCIEIAPDSWDVARGIAELVGNQQGCAAVIDYGANHVFAESLRAIRKHKFVHPLSQPGLVDLTADVDFSLLKHAVGELANCYGPIQQNEFLGRMGIETRLSTLLKNITSAKEQEELILGYNRLVDPSFMGKVYKVMAIAEKGMTPVVFESAEHS